MICYKDMTFCPFYKECQLGEKCFRALKPEVIEAAHVWWGDKTAPIAEYVEKPPCFVLEGAPLDEDRSGS